MSNNHANAKPCDCSHIIYYTLLAPLIFYTVYAATSSHFIITVMFRDPKQDFSFIRPFGNNNIFFYCAICKIPRLLIYYALNWDCQRVFLEESLLHKCFYLITPPLTPHSYKRCQYIMNVPYSYIFLTIKLSLF